MWKDKNESSNSPVIQIGEYSQIEIVLLRWIEIIIACVCMIVLFYTLFFCPSMEQIKWRYVGLITAELIILIIAILLYKQKKFSFSSNLLILAGVIGPWWSALIDASVINGNLFPLVYTTIPILLSSFFSPVYITILIGIVQSLGLAAFIYIGNFDLSLGSASLFFFVLFIFAISLIINIQNRNNREIISRQVEQLADFAIRDPLTNLHNRRFPFEFLKNEFIRLKKVGGILSIVVFDIDDFKTFNDTYGHDCGDEILVSISDLIRKNFRQTDVSCRYGGDEFFIAMSGTGIEEARKKIEILQKLIAEEKFESFLSGEAKVTISVGIAAYPQHGETVNAVLKAADQALYKAKESGKNCIEIME